MSNKQIKWDKEDLVRRLCHALGIAEQVIKRLAINGYTDPVEPAVSVRPEKLISETAVLLLSASAAAQYPEVSARVKCVAQLLIPHARSERMLLGVCLEPSLALDYAQAHACLTHLGFSDPGFDALLRQGVNSQAFAGRERTPHRMLEQQWIAELWDNSTSGSPQRGRSMATKSVLSLPMDLLGGSREDVYAFTHALMFVADFNLRPRRLPRQRALILAEAEAALARCLDEQDYDLGGEVLLAWPLTGRSWSAAAVFGFRVLARVEDAAGFLPSPSTRIERLNKLQGDERANYLLATAYHTAYVMGLLSAASLRPARTPPLNVPTGAARSGAAYPILQLLDADRRTTHWRDELERLTELERDALAGFLLTAALRRRIRERDFGAVRELLRVGYALSLADTPASSQAAEMLDRLATLGEITREKQIKEDSARSTLRCPVSGVRTRNERSRAHELGAGFAMTAGR